MTNSSDNTAAPTHNYSLLIKQLLATPLAHAPDQEITYQGSTRYTYRDLRTRIGRLANALAAQGVQQGSTVAVMDWDSHRYLECYFAIPMMGAVMMTVNIHLSPEQILYTLNHARADVVLVHEDFLPMLEAFKGKLETVRGVVQISDHFQNSATAQPEALDYESLLATAAPDFAFPDFDENTRATTFYTTGTTGLPKGVFFSHRQLVLHTITVMAALSSPATSQRFHRGDVYMPLTPMFHVHAWGLPYVATVLGVKQVYPGRYATDKALRLIKEEGVTFSHCVLTILHMILNTPGSQDVDLSKWKVVVGGGALTQGLAKAAVGRGIDVFTGYGMSETCPGLTLAQIKSSDGANPHEELRLRCKTGLPIPLVDLRIVDGEMRDLPHDGSAVGEIVVRAPWLTQGYVSDPQASAQLWAGGYLHTQDIATVDAEGYVQITDRMKDVIKTGGEWVSSLELENLISQHAGVAECAVVGIADERWGERPLAIIVARPEYGDLTEDGIKNHVRGFSDRGVISKYAVPERVRFVSAIDRTSVGKLNKVALREKYA